MQNELASIRQARENEVKEIETLRGHVVSLFKDLADARGLIGRLRIDCHSRGHTKTLSATRHVDIASMTSTSTDLPVRSTEQDTPSAINADIMARLSDVQDVQVLADALLQEQRPKLVEGLVSGLLAFFIILLFCALFVFTVISFVVCIVFVYSLCAWFKHASCG